jgi:ABC-type multidrug transport system fused ATPase/permease subunit
MDVEPEIRDRPGAVAMKNVRGKIDIETVNFRYGDEESPILDNINLSIEPGTTVALVGESGAGKSTLASLLPRFYEPEAGTIKLDGVDIMDIKQHTLRESIGIVQQTPFMFDATLRENILLGCPEASDDEILAAAREANILDFIESLPEGLDALVGEHGVKLSGGQKQRIAIARVFLKNPPLLIFDEATSSLDTESEKLIQSAMERLCQNRTTLIIAHRLSTVRQADYTYVLRAGQMVEQGTHAQLMEQEGHYYRLYTTGATIG